MMIILILSLLLQNERNTAVLRYDAEHLASSFSLPFPSSALNCDIDPGRRESSPKSHPRNTSEPASVVQRVSKHSHVPKASKKTGRAYQIIPMRIREPAIPQVTILRKLAVMSEEAVKVSAGVPVRTCQ
jgi:hypothetical protein